MVAPLKFTSKITNLVSILPSTAQSQHYLLGSATLTSAVTGLVQNSDFSLAATSNNFTTPPINVVLRPNTTTDPTQMLMVTNNENTFQTDIDDVTDSVFEIFIKTAKAQASPKSFPHIANSQTQG